MEEEKEEERFRPMGNEKFRNNIKIEFEILLVAEAGGGGGRRRKKSGGG